MLKNFLTVFSATAIAVFPVFAQDSTHEEQKEQDKITISTIAPQLSSMYNNRLVSVKYKFKPGKTGYKPNSPGFFCRICGKIHKLNTDKLIQENNSFFIPGIALDDKTVISRNLLIPEDNIAKISIVTADGKNIPANITAFYPGENAVAVVAESSIDDNLKPVEFKDANENDQLFTMFAGIEQGKRIAGITPFSTAAAVKVGGKMEYMIPVPPLSMIVNSDGQPVGITIDSDIEVDSLEKWRHDPAAWESISIQQYRDNISKIASELHDNTVPVRIKLTPLPKTTSANNLWADRKDDEIKTFALILNSGELFVPEMMSIADSNRIQEFWINYNGNTIKAEYVGSLKKYGAIIIKPEEPLQAKGIQFNLQSPELIEEQLLYTVITHPMDNRMEFQIMPSRKDGTVSRDDMIYPTFFPEEEQELVFSADGKICFAALNLREKNNPGKYFNIAANKLVPQLNQFNPDYAPKKDQILAIGWLGVQYQSMDEELAYSQGISHLTENGEKGLIVTAIMPGSPAEKAGIEPGDVLISIIPDSNPTPIELTSNDFYTYNFGFPWEYYDQIPENYYDEIPMPWPDYNDKLNNILSAYGIGSGYTLNYIRNAENCSAQMTVEAAPESFFNTPRMVSNALGITIANLTSEVRHYLKMADNDPGVVIARVKSGSKAAVAGMKPYEIITKVDDTPVFSIKQMNELCQGKSHLKFEIKRLNISRIVSVKTDENVSFKNL